MFSDESNLARSSAKPPSKIYGCHDSHPSLWLPSEFMAAMISDRCGNHGNHKYVKENMAAIFRVNAGFWKYRFGESGSLHARLTTSLFFAKNKQLLEKMAAINSTPRKSWQP